MKLQHTHAMTALAFGLLIATYVSPLFTEAAKNVNFSFPEGASAISSLVDGSVPTTLLFLWGAKAEQREAVIANQAGLHARPANTFVKQAKSFQSQIWIETPRGRIDAKNIVKVLSLGASKGTPVTITAEGPDEAEAAKALAEFIESKFGEE
jgi:phosphocarrier protein HPr